jgi:hypothetical protein
MQNVMTKESSPMMTVHKGNTSSLRWVGVKPISECRCNERLKTKSEESTRLVYTGLFGELEHLKIKTRLIDEKCASVMGECVI